MASNWYFATRVGMRFADGQVTPSGCGQMVFANGTASVSDPRSGQLLFYSDGRNVWNREHRPMNNGQGLFGWGTQAALAVPVPGRDSLYYFFTLQTRFAINFGGRPVDPAQTGFYYSVVDLRTAASPDGLGAVTLKNLPLAGGELTEKLTGTIHTNGRDYWVLAHRLNSNEFLAWPVTAAGVGAPVVSAVGSPHTLDTSDFLSYTWSGHMKLSPDGRQLACAVACRNSCPFEVFDFDPATGRVANPRQLDRFAYQYGLSYSPDNTKLYLTASPVIEGDYYLSGRLFQYDLTQSPPQRTFIWPDRQAEPGPNEPVRAVSFGAGSLQLGLDGRLYTGGWLEEVWVIHYPNRAGNVCQPKSHRFDFLAGHPEALGQNRRDPTSLFPNYMDHIFNGLEAAEWAEGGPADEGTELRVYPNPTTGMVNFALPGAADGCGPARPARLALYTAVGQTLAAGQEADFATGPVRWDLGTLAAGLYLARVEVAGRVWVRKIVVLPRE
jgi:hypothetical protein